MNRDLAKFNQQVRKWADGQPRKYRKTALAFGYRCDTETHSFSGTEKWISQQSRKRSGEGVSERTIQRHLKAFEKHGVIEVERRRNGDKNMSSVYTVHFDRFITDDDSAAFLASLTSLGPNEPARNTPTTDLDGNCNCIGCARGDGCIWADW